MAKLPENFIGTEALEHVAEQVSKEIFMGPGYTDAEEMDRLGIDIIQGIQFKRTFHIFLRQGGTTRRKDVHKEVNSTAGFLKERTLVAKLAWDHFTDNADNYCETIFGTDAQGSYPMSTTAVEAILKNYADNLAAPLWNGAIDLDNGDDDIPAHDQAMALYNGFHTCIKQDIEAGLISEANGNLVPCGAISAPINKDDTTPYDNFLAWHLKWDARLRKQNVRVYMSELTAQYIYNGYVNKFSGNQDIKHEAGDNFKLPGLSRVTICPIADFGEGDRMYATIDKNFVYGVDTLSNETFVGVKVGTDKDLRDIQFQIQSIQGAGVKNPFKYAFCMSDGSLAPAEYVAGDYDNTNLVVTVVGDGEVEVNGTKYEKPIETALNDVITLSVPESAKAKFINWSNGSDKPSIQLIATGMNMGITAFFQE